MRLCLDVSGISFSFGRAELEALEVYLKLIQGSLSENDEAVQKLIQQKILQKA